MKKLLLFLTLMISLAACTKDEPVYTGESMLAKAPKIRIYEGSLETRGTNTNANMWNQDWDCPPRPAEDLTQEELIELKALLSKGTEIHNTIVLPFENYYVQQIYKGEDRYYATDKDGKNTSTNEIGSNKMEHLQAMGNGGYEHIENFNYGKNENYPSSCGCGIVHYKTTLKTGMPTEGLNPETQFGFDETWGTQPKFFNNYYIVEYKGYYYVGFDYEAHAPERQNPNEARDIERDWNFTDWIVRITPAYYKNQTPDPSNPGGITDKPTINPDTPEEPTPNDPIPNDTLTDNHRNEVEVNLQGVEKNGDYLESHLSIHVRHATDIEIFIPVPAEYYCKADDMDIVMKHEKNHMVHASSYTLKDSNYTVKVIVSYEDDGIRITTSGITQEVIDWCYKKCKDGLTIEVWNYFNDPETGIPYLSIDKLKEYLNQATIKFLDSEPEYYINGKADDADCDVGIIEEQSNDYSYKGRGNHLNGSDKNEIYERK